MKKRLLYLALALFGAPLLWGQSQVVCTTAAPGSVIAACTATANPLTLINVVGTTSSCSVGVLDTAGSVCLGTSSVTGEGTTADGNETVLAFGDASADNTLTFKGTASGVEATVTTGSLLTGAGTGTGRVSVGGVLCKGAPAAATAGTSEEILATCTIPAATVSANGSGLRITFFAHTAANANNKQFRIRIGGIGGTVVADSTAVAANNLNISAAASHLTRASATTATAFGVTWFFTNAASSTISTTTYSSQRAAAVTWANANDLVFTGTTPTAAGDLTLDSYTVEVVQ